MVVLDPEVKERALAATRVLARAGRVRAAYVFGSHVEGRADRWSDIDIAAFMDDVENRDLWRQARVIVAVQKEVGFDVEAHLFPASESLNPVPGSFAHYVLRHGAALDIDATSFPGPMSSSATISG